MAFKDLYAINVNEYTEKREGLTYLSWVNAWAEIKKVHPEATYEIVKDYKGLPYFYDEKTGYMVFTNVTIDGLTYEMWLPVMDSKNKAMKSEPYKYTTKYGEKTVEAATMFDINKTIMRCLVKNLAMFGLGLYIYAGEDLPEVEKEEDKRPESVKQADTKLRVLKYINDNDDPKAVADWICKKWKVKSPSDLKPEDCLGVIKVLKDAGKEI